MRDTLPLNGGRSRFNDRLLVTVALTLGDMVGEEDSGVAVMIKVFVRVRVPLIDTEIGVGVTVLV